MAMLPMVGLRPIIPGTRVGMSHGTPVGIVPGTRGTVPGAIAGMVPVCGTGTTGAIVPGTLPIGDGTTVGAGMATTGAGMATMITTMPIGDIAAMAITVATWVARALAQEQDSQPIATDVRMWDKELVAAAMVSRHAAATVALAAVRLEQALVEDMLPLVVVTWAHVAVACRPATAAAFQGRLLVAVRQAAPTVAVAVRQADRIAAVAVRQAVPIAVAAVHPAVRRAAPTAVAAVDHRAVAAMVDHRVAVDVVDKASSLAQFINHSLTEDH